MQIQAIANTSDLRARLRKFESVMKRDSQDTLLQFARVACENLATNTQPFGKDRSAKIPGENAILADIGRVFYTPEPYGGFVEALTEAAQDSYRQKERRSKRGFSSDEATLKFYNRVNGYAAAGNYKALRKLAQDFNWKGVLEDIDPVIHQNARRGPRKRVKDTAFQSHLVLKPQRKLDRYIAQIQKKVGFTKAGWAKCADEVPMRGRVSSRTRGIPQFVTRHKHRALGRTEVRYAADKIDTKVVMTNLTPWASQCITQRQVRSALDFAKRKFVEYMNRTVMAELRSQIKAKAA